MASSLARFVEKSNLPLSVKTSVLALTGEEDGSMMHAAGSTLRQTSESLLVGGLLGAYHGMSAKGLDSMGAPADAIVAGGGFVASIALHATDLKHEARNIASTGAGIFAFRKTAEYVAAKRAHVAVAGEGFDGDDDDDADFDVSEDELLASARDL